MEIASDVDLSPVDESPNLLKLYRVMRLIRSFEETALLQSSLGKVHGALHLSIGQEAIAAGVCSHLTDGDFVASTHRGHAHCLAKGAPAKQMMAELFGRLNGSCKGRGGSMHIADIDRGVIGCNGVVAANLAIAAGVADALKRTSKGNIVACFLGEGATNRGPFLEALNLAATWRLPVLYICENNRYAQYTPFSATTKVVDVTGRAEALGIGTRHCDGMDVSEVADVAKELAEQVRKSSEPAFLLADTYRFMGHALGDTNYYRSKDEIQKERERDPITLARSRLAGLGMNKESATCDTDIQRELEEAVRFANSGEIPSGSDVGKFVYSSSVTDRIRSLGWEVLDGCAR